MKIYGKELHVLLVVCFLWLDTSWVGEHCVKDTVLNVFLSACLKAKYNSY